MSTSECCIEERFGYFSVRFLRIDWETCQETHCVIKWKFSSVLCLGSSDRLTYSKFMQGLAFQKKLPRATFFRQKFSHDSDNYFFCQEPQLLKFYLKFTHFCTKRPVYEDFRNRYVAIKIFTMPFWCVYNHNGGSFFIFTRFWKS